MKVFYEAQLSAPEGRWGMTLTISRNDHPSRWTSPWFALPYMKLQTFTEAQVRAGEQIRALRNALEGPEHIRGSGVQTSVVEILPKPGAWKCSNGHWFLYEAPPLWPPWCGASENCDSPDFKWVEKRISGTHVHGDPSAQCTNDPCPYFGEKYAYSDGQPKHAVSCNDEDCHGECVTWRGPRHAKELPDQEPYWER